MKKLLILTLLFVFCLPVYSFEKKYTPDGFVDISEQQKYGRALEKAYWAKVDSGEVDNSRRTYAHCVDIPLIEFIEKYRACNDIQEWEQFKKQKYQDIPKIYDFYKDKN